MTSEMIPRWDSMSSAFAARIGAVFSSSAFAMASKALFFVSVSAAASAVRALRALLISSCVFISCFL